MTMTERSALAEQMKKETPIAGVTIEECDGAKLLLHRHATGWSLFVMATESALNEPGRDDAKAWARLFGVKNPEPERATGTRPGWLVVWPDTPPGPVARQGRLL